MEFDKLNINKDIIKNVKDRGYQNLTKIQEEIIPLLLTENCDVFACAQTGTGKTAAYALPILDRLIRQKNESNTVDRNPQCLIVAPTRELAIQIYQNFLAYSNKLNLTVSLYYGGIKLTKQLKTNKLNSDIVIATPGRLIELQNRKVIKLNEVKILVIDEADHMLDMGFVDDMNKIISFLPKNKQILLFSATLSEEIKLFVSKKMNNPKFINVNAPNSVAKLVDQTIYFVNPQQRLAALILLLKTYEKYKILIFSQTKKEANFLGKVFDNLKIKNEVIHSNKNQLIRQKIVGKFQHGLLNVLIATDVISRGLHINNINLVINYQLPKNPESYVHRVGRTGRAGNTGKSISFCTKKEIKWLSAIESFMKESINKTDNLFAQKDLEEEQKKLQILLEKNNAKKTHYPKRAIHHQNKLNFAKTNSKHKSNKKQIRFVLHNHLRKNFKKQHQIPTFQKEANSDSW